MMTETLSAACRIAVLTVGAPAIGGVLLLAIARLTGAAWMPAALPLPLLPILFAGAVLLGIAQVAVPAPAHLTGWMHPLAVAARGGLAAGALWLAGRRMLGDASTTFAAILLALYTALVTPIAGDWLLGQEPGHAVSSAGMMLACAEIAAACALPLAIGAGEARFRSDMAKLMIAAALGLGYLGFMDYLIVWYGNLPSRTGFYVGRTSGATAVLPGAALLFGWVVPIGLLWRGGERAQRGAGMAVLAALFLFHCWWVGGGWPAAVIAAIVSAVAIRWRAARG